jgi:hypothetical protein
MLALNRYLAVSIAWIVSSSSIFWAVSKLGAQKIGGLETCFADRDYGFGGGWDYRRRQIDASRKAAA